MEQWITDTDCKNIVELGEAILNKEEHSDSCHPKVVGVVGLKAQQIIIETPK